MDAFINLFLSGSIWGVAKIFVLLALLIYLIFAIVVVKQVNTMTQVVSGELNLPIKVAGWIHLGFVLLIILIALVVL
ncbi:MAG: DUF5657 family protein [Patescibacteria group bacterium]